MFVNWPPESPSAMFPTPSFLFSSARIRTPVASPPTAWNMDVPNDRRARDSKAESARPEGRVSRASRRMRRKMTAVHVRALGDKLQSFARQGAGGRAAAVELLQTIDREADFSPTVRSMFQDLLGAWGVSTPHPIGIHENDTPYWLQIGRAPGREI